jgi:site-specific recombinase XerD
MASLDFDPASGRFRIRFRYAGRPYKRSIKTTNPREAKAILGRVQETLMLVERGRIEIPADADPGAFILSDGKRNGKAVAPKVRTLADLFDLYEQSVPVGAKETNTLDGEKRHMRHIKRHLKATSIVQAITVADLQRYVELRGKDCWLGESIQPDTIRKELTTFRLIWNWSADHGYLKGRAPLKGLKYPMRPEKPPFMTFGEIERKIGRGGFSEQEQEGLWECLFLTRDEIADLLAHVSGRVGASIVYPMSVFVAHTGARRSELLRSEVDDFDFTLKTIQIREKKKSRSKSVTFRCIPMTDQLAEAMDAWFKFHPGGRFSLCTKANVPLEPTKAHKLLKSGFQGHAKWSKVRGFHVLRHSFASNLAAAGVDQRVIDEWMGHQTDEMRRRYRHLFPDQRRYAIESVFGRNAQ